MGNEDMQAERDRDMLKATVNVTQLKGPKGRLRYVSSKGMIGMYK